MVEVVGLHLYMDTHYLFRLRIHVLYIITPPYIKGIKHLHHFHHLHPTNTCSPSFMQPFCGSGLGSLFSNASSHVRICRPHGHSGMTLKTTSPHLPK